MKFTDYLKDNDKPKLNFVEKTIRVVDYHTFEDFVMSIYGGDYEFADVQEGSNDSNYTFKPTGKISDFDKKRAEQIKSGEYPSYSNNLIFNLLVKEGYLEAGEYMVKVSW